MAGGTIVGGTIGLAAGLAVGASDAEMVFEIATDDVITVEESDTIATAAATMVDNRIHRLIVLRAGIPIGIVSSLDMAKLLVGPSDSRF